jgi:tetratricopeptide (TPR) repeat protein/transcriptional regulator with XRE-family HTH domain
MGGEQGMATVSVSTLTFGALLKRHRRAARMTQAQLAERAGFSVVYISMLERGARQPQRTTVALLVDALDLAAEERTALEAAARLPSAPLSLRRENGPVEDAGTAVLPIGGFLGGDADGGAGGSHGGTGHDHRHPGGRRRGRGACSSWWASQGWARRGWRKRSRCGRARGFRVITGRCYEPQQGVAYYPFLEALALAEAGANTAVQAQLSQDWPEVARLLPDRMASAQTPIQLDDHNAQQRLFWQVSGFLVALAEHAPLALLLDDLHWADRASLDLLQHLARHTRERPILLVGTTRAVEAQRQHPLADALSDLGRDELVERLTLRPLAAEETSALIGVTLGGADGAAGEAASISPELAQRIYARSEGNAFFTRQLARALHEQGDLAFAEGQWRLSDGATAAVSAPESIRAVIGQRLGRLSALTQDVLREASVLGQVFTFEDLRRMAGRGEQEMEEALEEAVAAGIVREAERDRYGMNHALTRDTLYADLSARRKRRLHRAAGEAIESLNATERDKRAAEVAYHLLAADEGARALPYVLVAGDQAEAVYAHAEAEKYYRSAAAVASELGDRAQEAAALEKLGDLHFSLARTADALEVYGTAAHIYRALEDTEGLRRVTARSAEELAYAGAPAQGRALLQPLLDAAMDEEASSSLADLYLSFAWLCGDPIERLDACERAAGIAQKIGDTTTFAEAEFLRGNTLLGQLGRIDEARHILENILPLLEAKGNLRRLCSVCNLLAQASLRSGEFDAARKYADRALEVATQVGVPAQLAWTYCTHGEVAYYTGDWRQAYRDFEDGDSMYQQGGTVGDSSYASWGKGVVLLAYGEIEQASQFLEEAITRAETGGDAGGQQLQAGHAALAERDLVAGQFEAARIRIERLIERLQGWHGLVARVLTLLAWAHLELEEHDQANSVILDAISAASSGSQPLLLMEALRVKGMASTRQQRWEEAEAALGEALGLSQAMPNPYAEAKIQYAFGLLRLDRGEPLEARIRLETARDICRRLGERPYHDRIAQSLTRLARA